MLEDDQKFWYLLVFFVNVGFCYIIMEDCLIVKGDFFLENGVFYLNLEIMEVDNLNGLFDFSFGVDFFFLEKFGGFV